MISTTHIDALRQQITAWRREGLRIGFVPTMGNLHEGHLTLVREAHKQCDRVVVSIFVNPMQFNNAGDLAAYPRTEDADCTLLRTEGVDLVFLPTPEIMYPRGLDKQAYVEVPELGEKLEGASRPGHFRGVSTVVTMLFNLVQPDVACFGQKDYQQLALIRQMVTDLAMPIDIVGVPTVRADDGLALSSRNGYLSAAERQKAPALYQVLNELKVQIQAGERNYSQLVNKANQKLELAGFEPDRIDICQAQTLDPAQADDSELVILAAAFLGQARLIDNLTLQL